MNSMYSNSQMIYSTIAVVHAILFLIPIVTEPGANDVPLAEGIFLVCGTKRLR
jgi:hypothetical protein